jgi:hypothetical protein
MEITVETIALKDHRIFNSIYSLLKIECLSINTKLTFYTALIRSVQIYVCPAR